MTGEEIHLHIPARELALMKGVQDDRPALWVVNATLPQFQHRDIFPWYLSLVIEARETDAEGMPTPEEWEKMDALGERLEQSLLATRTERGAENAVFLARFTWNGRRQQIYYADDAKPLDQTLQEALAQGNSQCE